MPQENPGMAVIEESRLWQRTLAPQKDGNKLVEQDKQTLREMFTKMRGMVAIIIQDIPRDLKEFTIHDISHLDALWEMADLILGDDYRITPLEAFVFGCSVLLHDAGLTLSAYPGGWEQIKSMPEWKDGVVLEFRRRNLRDPEEEEIRQLPHEMQVSVLEAILRENHARQASVMATQTWTSGGVQYHLLDDVDARKDLGPLIGDIAYSHWWDLTEVEAHFVADRNPSWCRYAGGVRPLIVACLLRCADAIHLDARRAPRFNRALRNLSSYSAKHWDFQERLDAPTRKEDAIRFTGSGFTEEDFEAWWLCYEMLSMANDELEKCHALLSDKGLSTFAAHRIHSVNDVSRLGELIRTEGWTPVNAPVHISNVASVVMELGGKSLYGDKLWVVVRELIQNSADAIRARRVLENRDKHWGAIRIELADDERSLSISDEGIGMSEFVVKNYLLDFFKSFWTSSIVRKEFKGRIGELKNTGKFGIGFFSVFMIAKRVKIVSRSGLGANSRTIVVEFKDGYCDRPVLRDASEDERLFEPGTSVELFFNEGFDVSELWRGTEATSFAELVGYVAPALDVDLFVTVDSKKGFVVRSEDWKELDGLKLLKRIRPSTFKLEKREKHKEVRAAYLERISKCFSTLERGENVVGRLAITHGGLQVEVGESTPDNVGVILSGVITCGGLRIGKLEGFAGLIEGDVVDASRSTGVAKVDEACLLKWVSTQESLIRTQFVDDPLPYDHNAAKLLLGFTKVLSYLKQGPIEGLPICVSNKGKLLTRNELAPHLEFNELYVIEYHPRRAEAKEGLTQEKLVNLLKRSDFQAQREAFNYVPEDIADNVLILPTYLIYDTAYQGLRKQNAFSTENRSDKIIAALRQYGDPTGVSFALHRQIVYVIKEHWGESIDVSTEMKSLRIPTKTGPSVDAHGFVFRRSKPISESR